MTTAAHNAQTKTLADLAARIKTEHETVIRAELIGSNRCAALGMTVSATAPVMALCRQLIAAGHDPGLPLEAWRGPILCLRVRSIGEAAELRLATHGGGFERLPGYAAGCTIASPVRENAAPPCPTPDRPKRTSEAAVL
jgi:hypothetical protein